MENSLKPAPSIDANSIQSLALPKILLAWGTPKKPTSQEDEFIDFVANDRISTLNENCDKGYISTRYDDLMVLHETHNLLRLKIKNEFWFWNRHSLQRIEYDQREKL